MLAKHLMLNNINTLIVRAESLRQNGLTQQAQTCESHARRLQEKFHLEELNIENRFFADKQPSTKHPLPS